MGNKTNGESLSKVCLHIFKTILLACGCLSLYCLAKTLGNESLESGSQRLSARIFALALLFNLISVLNHSNGSKLDKRAL